MVVSIWPPGIRSQACFFVSPRWGKSKNAFWTQLNDLRQPGFLRCLEKPTQNGGIKPTSWNSIPRVFIRFAPMGKVETTRFERNWTTFANPAFCAALKSLPKMVVWNRFRGMRSQGCLFASPRWGNCTTFVNPPFRAAWKSPPKMVVWNRPRGIRFQGCLFTSPQWGKSKQRVLNAIGRPSSTRLLALLGKPTQNGGMKPTSCNSIPRIFIRFAPMAKLAATHFERNWLTFVNPAFCTALKSPPKMALWNRPRGNRSQGCLFASPRWAKSKQRVVNAIGRPSSTRLFALLGKAHPKWWYETDLVKLDPKGVSSLRPDGEYRNNAVSTQLDDLRQPGFLRCFEKRTQNGGTKPTSWHSIPRVFIRFAPMGKVETTRFERNWTTFVNKAFCAASKRPPKMVVWNRPREIRSQGFLFASPRWGKSKQRVLIAIGRPSSTRLYALLGKAHQKWWYETELVEFDPKGVCSLRPDGGSRNNVFWTQFDDLSHPAFCAGWKTPP